MHHCQGPCCLCVHAQSLALTLCGSAHQPVGPRAWRAPWHHLGTCGCEGCLMPSRVLQDGSSLVSLLPEWTRFLAQAAGARP